jgi:prolyl oligopeptidase
MNCLRLASVWIAAAMTASCVSGALRVPADAKHTAEKLSPPPTKRIALTESVHGHLVSDPYRWLEEGTSREVMAWTEAQDLFAERQLSKMPQVGRFKTRLGKLFAIDELALIAARGKTLFYSRREAKQERPVIYARHQDAAHSERVAYDPNHTTAVPSASLRGFAPSIDGRRAVYASSRNNTDAVDLHVINLSSDPPVEEETIPDLIDTAIAWTPNSDGFYYRSGGGAGSTSERVAHSQIRLHAIGTSISTDSTIRGETGSSSRYEEVVTNAACNWLLLREYIGERQTNLYVRRIGAAASSPWTPISQASDTHSQGACRGDELFVRTDEGATRGRVFSVDLKQIPHVVPRDVVAEREGVTLNEIAVIGGRLALRMSTGPTSQIELRDLDGGHSIVVSLPRGGTVASMAGEPGGDVGYASYTSYSEPYQVWQFSSRDGSAEPTAKPHATVDSTAYVTEELFAKSRDGTRVPFLLTRGRAMAPKQNLPAMLYGYGGFGVSTAPEFLPPAVAWIDAGGIYVDAVIRGGGEFGEEWHRAGSKTRKQNAINDYIAIAETLVDLEWTSKERLVARGGSNGGLLVGAAMTQRPDLFAVAILRVPVLDMVRFPLFGAGGTWVEEYGAPSNPEELDALLSYSPYHHVSIGKKYPATFIRSAENDDRVDPMHARKFAAALQYASTGGPVYLRTERNAGHGGDGGVSSEIELLAESDGFAFAQMGLQ